MKNAQGNAQINIEQALKEAKAQYGDYADIGRRQGLYKLAALMGDERFGSAEAGELYSLKAPELMLPDEPSGSYGGTLGKLLGKKKKAASARNDYDNAVVAARAKYDADLADYNRRKAELEQVVARQKADGTYRVGADYLADSDAYKFRYNEGQNNLLRGMNASHGIFSGGALREADKYSQDFASNEFNNQFNRLATMAGIGQNASTAIANTAVGGGTSLANLALSGGQNSANYYANMNNVAQGTIGNIATANERNKYASSYRDPYKTTIGGG